MHMENKWSWTQSSVAREEMAEGQENTGKVRQMQLQLGAHVHVFFQTKMKKILVKNNGGSNS